jgi:uncharacterized protein
MARRSLASIKAAAFGLGGDYRTVGGLVGLAGVEFRVPLLIGGFNFPAFEADSQQSD